MKLNSETKVGLLAALSIALLIVGYNYLENNKIFGQRFELVAYYDNTAGLTSGNPVVYNGNTVGQVRNIIQGDGTDKIKVIFSVNENLKIPVDSRALIESNLLGSMSVRIEPGKEVQYAKSGHVLLGQKKLSTTEELQQSVLPIIQGIDTFVSYLNQLMGTLNNTLDESAANRIDDILQNFSVVTRGIAESTTSYDSVMRSVQGITANVNYLLNDVRGFTKTIDKTLVNVGHISDSLEQASGRLITIGDKTSAMLDSISGLIAEVKYGEGSLSKFIQDPALYDKVNDVAEEVEDVVKEVKDGIKVGPFKVKIDEDNRSRAEIRDEKRRLKLQQKQQKRNKQ